MFPPVKYIKMRFPLLYSTPQGGFKIHWCPNLTYLHWFLARTMHKGGEGQFALQQNHIFFYKRYHLGDLDLDTNSP